MFIHKVSEHFPDILNSVIKCPACSQAFVAGNGVTYEGQVRTGETELTYVRVAMCSYACVIVVAYAENWSTQ